MTWNTLGMPSRAQAETPSSHRRILVLMPDLLSVGGGQERDMIRVARWLIEAGHEVRVAQFNTRLRNEARLSELVLREQLPSIVRQVLPVLPWISELVPIPSPLGFGRFRSLIHWADLVIACPYFVEDVVLATACRVAGTPVIFSLNSSLAHAVEGSPKDALQDVWNRTLGLQAIRTGIALRAMGALDLDLLKQWGVKRGFVLYPGNFGSSPESFNSSGAEADASFSAPPAGSSPLRVLLLGRLTFQKGVDVVDRIMERLVQDGRSQDYEFTFVGSSALPPELRRWSRSSSINVRVLGILPAPELYSQIRQHDVLMMPSRYEGLGTAAVDSISQGTPVIASDIRGLREVIIPGTTGWLAPSGDVEGFLGALASCREMKRSNVTGWAALQERCVDYWRTTFGPAVVALQFRHLSELILRVPPKHVRVPRIALGREG